VDVNYRIAAIRCRELPEDDRNSDTKKAAESCWNLTEISEVFGGSMADTSYRDLPENGRYEEIVDAGICRRLPEVNAKIMCVRDAVAWRKLPKSERRVVVNGVAECRRKLPQNIRVVKDGVNVPRFGKLPRGVKNFPISNAT
jgi:hypothetical protein